MPETDEELAYYRAVEDFFAAMRGVVHELSPKDFQLLRQWWRDEVPLRAVTSGIAEVVNKRKNEGREPVVSLRFCRHAVKRNAKRLAEMHVGGDDEARHDENQLPDSAAAVSGLIERLETAARHQEQERPGVAAAVRVIVPHLAEAATMPAAALEELLYSLEIALLESCRRALAPAQQQQLEAAARAAAEQTGASGGALQRTVRAMLDREVRSLLQLPRMELDL